MHRIYRSIDRLNDGVGSVVAWFALAMVLIQFVLVLMRYIYSANAFAGLSALWWQESIVYLHGGLIMLAAAYTFLHNGHVRVDIFYRTASPRAQDIVDILGCLLFVLPMCWLVLWSAWPNVAASWRNLEGSTETSGIPFRYLLRSTVIAFAALIALQAVSTMLKAALRLAGHDVDDPYRGEDSLD